MTAGLQIAAVHALPEDDQARVRKIEGAAIAIDGVAPSTTRCGWT